MQGLWSNFSSLLHIGKVSEYCVLYDLKTSGTVWNRWAESTTKSKRIVAKQMRSVDWTCVKPKEKGKRDI